MFRQANNHCERVFDVFKITYADKTKESMTSQKLNLCNFWQIANIVLTKGESATFCLPNDSEMVSSAHDKAKLFAESFVKTVILMTQLFFYLIYPLELYIIFMHDIYVTPKFVKR